MFAYCGNNPVHRIDDNGLLWDTIFDIVSLCFSIGEVISNPADPLAWAGLGGDIIDLVPFVTGVGETAKVVGATIRVADQADNVVDTIHIVKATDFTDEAIDTIQTLKKVGNATVSARDTGIAIHNGYKTGQNVGKILEKEATRGNIRLDFLDDLHHIIYELKPNNIRGIRNGIRQLQRYNKELGRGYTLFLELY